jgi:hypothetical protein
MWLKKMLWMKYCRREGRLKKKEDQDMLIILPLKIIYLKILQGMKILT